MLLVDYIMFYLLLAISILGGKPAQSSPPDSARSVVTVIRVKGAINPPAANYVVRGIRQSNEVGAECLIVELDTPGGLLQSMKEIVQAFLDSKDLPIIVYVSPEGASAASAGTFITMAAHIAAMAPTTNIGAASPVQMAPGGGTTQPDTVMQKKLFNYSESYIQTIAERRGRNAKWAISAVRDGKSITADEALKLNVIDLMAKNRQELLDKINGRTAAGKTLQTRDALIKEIPTNLAENFLGFIMRSQVILILTLIAIYGIVGEVTNPGAVLPGTAGGIALILVLYASAAMPINVAGFALIGLAIILFIAEAFTPTFGVLIAGGAVSFFLGMLMLFQDLPPSMTLSWAWLIPATLLTVLFFVWIAGAGIKIQFTKSITGKEAMIGKRAEVTDTISRNGGRIFLQGSYWNAISDDSIKEGKQCEVIAIQGLTIKVRPVTDSKEKTDDSNLS